MARRFLNFLNRERERDANCLSIDSLYTDIRR